MEVEITLKIDESYAEAIQQFAENHGGQEIIISKTLKFEDLGLAPIEEGKYQCLACSKTYPSKSNAVRHYKNTHISRVEPTTQCPRYFISHFFTFFILHFDSESNRHDLSLEPFVVQNFQTVAGMINTFSK